MPFRSRSRHLVQKAAHGVWRARIGCTRCAVYQASTCRKYQVRGTGGMAETSGVSNTACACPQFSLAEQPVDRRHNTEQREFEGEAIMLANFETIQWTYYALLTITVLLIAPFAFRLLRIIGMAMTCFAGCRRYNHFAKGAWYRPFSAWTMAADYRDQPDILTVLDRTASTESPATALHAGMPASTISSPGNQQLQQAWISMGATG